MRSHSFWSRAAIAFERWVCPLAWLVDRHLIDEPPPDLQAQMREILDAVSREESRWRVEDRIQGLLGYQLKRPPRSRPNG